jgi:hypothetical protein
MLELTVNRLCVKRENKVLKPIKTIYYVISPKQALAHISQRPEDRPKAGFNSYSPSGRSFQKLYFILNVYAVVALNFLQGGNHVTHQS